MGIPNANADTASFEKMAESMETKATETTDAKVEETNDTDSKTAE